MPSHPKGLHLHGGLAPELGRNAPTPHALDPVDELSRLAHAQARFLEHIIQAAVDMLRTVQKRLPAQRR
jgi:hypothetical protein